MGIDFVIIKTDAYQLESVFRPIAMRFDQLSLISLVGLIWNINNLFLFFIFIKKKFVQSIKKSIQQKLYKKKYVHPNNNDPKSKQYKLLTKTQTV